MEVINNQIILPTEDRVSRNNQSGYIIPENIMDLVILVKKNTKCIRELKNSGIGFGGFIREYAMTRPITANASTKGNTPI